MTTCTKAAFASERDAWLRLMQITYQPALLRAIIAAFLALADIE